MVPKFKFRKFQRKRIFFEYFSVKQEFTMPPPPPPPPPGPPPSASAAPPKLSKNDAQNRSALLGDICKGKRLKPSAHLTVDKSKPIVGSEGL